MGHVDFFGATNEQEKQVLWPDSNSGDTAQPESWAELPGGSREEAGVSSMAWEQKHSSNEVAEDGHSGVHTEFDTNMKSQDQRGSGTNGPVSALPLDKHVTVQLRGLGFRFPKMWLMLIVNSQGSIEDVGRSTTVYSFPLVALTNYHDFGGLNSTSLFSYSSGGQESLKGLCELRSKSCTPFWRF